MAFAEEGRAMRHESVGRLRLVVTLWLALAAARTATAQETYAVHAFALPGASPAGILMDYIAFDPSTRSLWVPAGNTGRVVVVDTASGALREIAGFPTAEVGSGDRKRTVGPSSAAVGDGVVYVGSRGDATVCAFDARSLAKRNCHKLDSMPDGLAYVATRNEVWATTPRDKSIRILDARSLDESAKLTFDGSPEGFAVDGPHGRFYTNLEDRDVTLAIDLKTRKTVETWKPGCGEEGPRGLRVDSGRNQLFVACTARAEVMDTAHGGRVLSSLDTGEGVDDMDYSPAAHRLYVGASRAGQLTVASVDGEGRLTATARVPTAKGARNPAVTDRGVVYLTHSSASELIVATPSR
jgi:DNA-binding beta-propeller fold protein YncE